MSFTLKRGLDELFCAEVLSDTAEEFTTGVPFKLIPAGEMAVSVDKDSTNYHFDNGVFATVGREGGSEITISGAALRAAAIAKLNSKDIDDATGAVMDSGSYTTKYFAFGGRTKNIDGTYEYFWFAKGSFAIPDDSAKTEGEDTDATGTELTYTAIQTVHKFEKTGKVCKRVVIDTETTELIAEADWFAQVVTPDNLATVCTKKATA